MRPQEVRRGNRVYTEWPYGHVYFATFTTPDDIRDAVKIGWSQNPWARVIQLGFECGAKVDVFETIRIPRGSKHWGVAYGSLEYRIHRELAAKRVHPWTLKFSDKGEWYGMSRAEAISLAAVIRHNVAREDAHTGASNGPTSSSASKERNDQQ